ncbi:uncharacterized protein EI90DRAFT_3037353 [Cantharellus anzutake]|uniref:uncharacterized protein n=1 Tax=Cantharellus anzutake TaxID=1750568 RepID=UPI001908EB70|nr:uncharacterized protein EI90DRAFT_3037353 [Cantharellus anzutake]KAF8339648.1 hypothetical protein EI90DRAFT_3037353 [Cantharellus anzutake]
MNVSYARLSFSCLCHSTLCMDLSISIAAATQQLTPYVTPVRQRCVHNSPSNSAPPQHALLRAHPVHDPLTTCMVIISIIISFITITINYILTSLSTLNTLLQCLELQAIPHSTHIRNGTNNADAARENNLTARLSIEIRRLNRINARSATDHRCCRCRHVPDTRYYVKPPWYVCSVNTKRTEGVNEDKLQAFKRHLLEL